MLSRMSRYRVWSLTLAAGVSIVTSSQAEAKRSTGACDVAREYIRLTEVQQYDRIGDLWADDAVFYAPNGRTIRGKEAIRQFYGKFLRSITPINRIGSLTFDRKANRCAMEIETRVIRGPNGEWVPDASGEFVGTVIDLFTVNRKGLVTRMKVFHAPKPVD